MGNQYLLSTLRSKIGTLLLWGVLFGALGFFGLMVAEKPFQTKMDFLVVQTNAGNQDFYTQFKSSEYLGNVLGEAIFSERFVNAVVETGKVNAEFLPFNKKDKLKAWKEMVAVQKNMELGIISVTVSGKSEREISRTMDAIAVVLAERNSLFRGGDEKSVEIRVLSGPILEQNPTLSKIAKVVMAAFLAGVFVATFFVVVKSELRPVVVGRDDEIPFNEMLV
jgi:capsular polysaccharide biosynthesis protein